MGVRYDVMLILIFSVAATINSTGSIVVQNKRDDLLFGCTYILYLVQSGWNRRTRTAGKRKAKQSVRRACNANGYKRFKGLPIFIPFVPGCKRADPCLFHNSFYFQFIRVLPLYINFICFKGNRKETELVNNRETEGGCAEKRYEIRLPRLI